MEKCDSVHAFFMTHSIGGGTGSGLGSRSEWLFRDMLIPLLVLTSVQTYSDLCLSNIPF